MDTGAGGNTLPFRTYQQMFMGIPLENIVTLEPNTKITWKQHEMCWIPVPHGQKEMPSLVPGHLIPPCCCCMSSRDSSIYRVYIESSFPSIMSLFDSCAAVAADVRWMAR